MVHRHSTSPIILGSKTTQYTVRSYPTTVWLHGSRGSEDRQAYAWQVFQSPHRLLGIAVCSQGSKWSLVDPRHVHRRPMIATNLILAPKMRRSYRNLDILMEHKTSDVPLILAETQDATPHCHDPFCVWLKTSLGARLAALEGEELTVTDEQIVAMLDALAYDDYDRPTLANAMRECGWYFSEDEQFWRPRQLLS